MVEEVGPQHPLRVLYVHHAEMVYGAAESLLSLLRHFPQGAVDATLLSPPGSALSTSGAEGVSTHIPVEPWELQLSPDPVVLARQWQGLTRLSAAIRSAAKAGTIDLIHANTWASAVAAARSGVRGVPLLWHVRDLKLRQFVPGWLRGRCAGQIAISRTVREFLVGRGYPADEVHLVYNGIDPADFEAKRSRDEIRSELGLDNDAPAIIAVARPAPWKRHELLLEAAAQVAAQVDGTQFLFAGALGEREEQRVAELRQLAADLGIAAQVHFLGHRDDVADVVGASDVFWHGADREPLGRVVLEAMMLSKAIVVPDSAGPGEMIDHEVTGLAVEPGSAPALAEGVVKMLTEPDFARRCGRQARRQVLTRFSADTMAAETLAVYRQVLQGSSP